MITFEAIHILKRDIPKGVIQCTFCLEILHLEYSIEPTLNRSAVSRKRHLIEHYIELPVN